MTRMVTLSTSSMTVIETVSDAKASPSAALHAMPARPQRHECHGIAKQKCQDDRQGYRRPITPSERCTEHHPKDLANRAPRKTVHGGHEGGVVQ